VKNGDEIISEMTLRKRRNELAENFLVPLKGYGSVILTENKSLFQEKEAELRADLERFRKGICDQLNSELERSARALAKDLATAVRENPPPGCTKQCGSSPNLASVERWVETRLRDSFGTAADVLEHAELRIVYKGVTPELVRDAGLIAQLKGGFPGSGESVRGE
jgi:hypothetical protein